MTTISLDFHDGSVIGTRYDLLKELKEHYPKLKVSLFFIPYDYQLEMTTQARMVRPQKLEELKSMLDWVELIPHGLSHMPSEFKNCDKHTMRMVMESIEDVMGKDGLPYVKGFCAPYWLWNQDVVDVLNENKWWGAVDRNQPGMARPKRFYEYNYSINEPFSEVRDDVLKLHGHMSPPSDNDLETCILNLMRMPHDAEFKFASEMVEVKS